MGDLGGSGGEGFTWLFKVFDEVSGPSLSGAKALDTLTASFDKATRSASAFDSASGKRSGLGGLRSSLADTVIVAQGVIGAIAGIANAVVDIGGSALRAGGKAFVGFNSDVEQSLISIAAVDRMFRQGHSFEDAQSAATKFFDDYQRAAAASTATTKDFLATHQALAPTLTRLGAADEQIANIVKGAVIAAPTLGFDASVANLDVRQLLTGNVGLRDQFATTLLQSAKVGVKEFNARARNDPAYAIDILSNAFNQPAIAEASKTMEGSLKGLSSTLFDNLEILGGKAGKPLFDTLKGGLKDVNEWMGLNRTTLDGYASQLGEVFSQGASKALQFGKDAFEWAMKPETIEKIGLIFDRIGAFGGVAISTGKALFSVGAALYSLADSLGIVTVLNAAFEYVPIALEGALGELTRGFEQLDGLFKQFDIKGWFIDLDTELGGIASTVVSWFEDIGERCGDGLIEGLRSTALGVKDGALEMAQGAVSSMKDALGIRSPSRVFAELGQFSAMGFSQGFEKERPLEIDLSQLSMPHAPATDIDLSGLVQPQAQSVPSLRGGSTTLNFYLTVDGSTPPQVAESIGMQIREQLLGVLEDLNLEGGG